jgi:pimeloyl-ACP methyl ester carboxylesterase
VGTARLRSSAIAVCVVLAAAVCSVATAAPPVRTGAGVARSYGQGAGKVWVITPKRGRPRSVVVFVHGWTATSPFDWHQPWLDHLVARGSIVLFPAYQPGRPDDAFTSTPAGLRAGLVAGFRALGGTKLPVVVAGYSVGGALAFEYAARAAAWHLPRPAAVMSIFPVDPLQVDPALLDLGPPRLRFLVLAGDRDEVVGQTGAKAFWHWLGPVPTPLKTYRLLRSTKSVVFEHESLKALGNPAVRAAFWEPLDGLVTSAR